MHLHVVDGVLFSAFKISFLRGEKTSCRVAVDRFLSLGWDSVKVSSLKIDANSCLWAKFLSLQLIKEDKFL